MQETILSLESNLKIKTEELNAEQTKEKLLNEENYKVEEQVNSLINEIQTLKQTLEKEKTNRSNLDQIIESLNNDHANITQENKSLKEQTTALKVGHQKLKGQYEKSQSDLEETKKKLTEINIDYDKKNTEINIINIKLKSLESVIAKKDSALNELRNHHSKKEESFKHEIKNKENEINILKTEKNKLEEKLEYQKKIKAEFMTKIEGLNKEIIRLKDIIINLESDLDKKDMEINDKKIKIESLEEQKDSLQSQNDLLIHELGELKKKLNEKETSGSDINVILESLKSFLDHLNQSNKPLKENFNKELKNKYEQNQNKLYEFKQKLKEIQSDYQKKDKDLNQIRENLESLMLEIIKNIYALNKLTEKVQPSPQKNEEARRSQKHKSKITITVTMASITTIKHSIRLSDLFYEINFPTDAIRDLKAFQKIAASSCSEKELSKPLARLFTKINESDLLKRYPQASSELTKRAIYMVYSLVKNGKISHACGLELLLYIRPFMGTFIDRAPLELYLSTLAYLIQSVPNNKESLKKRITTTFSSGEHNITLYKIIKQWIKDNYMDQKTKQINWPKYLKQALIQFKKQDLIPTDRQLYLLINTNQNDQKLNILEDHGDKSIEEIESIQKKDIPKESILRETTQLERIVGKGKVTFNSPGFFRTASTKRHESPDLEEKSSVKLTK